jgi:transposase
MHSKGEQKRRLIRMLHAGIDMHKRSSVVTVIDDQGNSVISGQKLDNDPSEIVDFFSSFDDEIHAVLEAGPSWHWLCDLLDDMGVDNVLCHPLKVKAIASARIKTDKIDSGILAQLLRMDFLPESYKPDLDTRMLKGRLRYRASLVKIRTGLKNRVHALLGLLNIRHGFSDLFGKAGLEFLKSLELAPAHRQALDGYLSVIADVKLLIKEAEAELNCYYLKSEDAQLLSTIPGVGPILALTIVSEIGDIDRFHSAKHLASYAGLVSSTSQSGDHSWHGHITRQGSPWLRWALIEAAIHTVTRPGPLKTSHNKLKKRKGVKIARVGSARKLSTYIYHMLKEKKEFSEVMAYRNGDLG